eukprot:41074_1
MSKKRRIKATDDEPSKKKQKVLKEEDLDSQIEVLDKLKTEKHKAVAKLQAKHDKEMNKLKQKYDPKIEQLENKISPLMSKKSLCMECHEKCTDKCADCGSLFCVDCTGEDDQCCEYYDCGNVFCENCLNKYEVNVEECCGQFYCRPGGCLSMHRNATQCMWR